MVPAGPFPPTLRPRHLVLGASSSGTNAARPNAPSEPQSGVDAQQRLAQAIDDLRLADSGRGEHAATPHHSVATPDQHSAADDDQHSVATDGCSHANSTHRVAATIDSYNTLSVPLSVNPNPSNILHHIWFRC
jgi:hypothetical protein